MSHLSHCDMKQFLQSSFGVPSEEIMRNVVWYKAQQGSSCDVQSRKQSCTWKDCISER